MTVATFRPIGWQRPFLTSSISLALLVTQKVEGHWRAGGVLYRDDLVRIVVDVPDSAANRQWMRGFKQKWRVRLEQIELWMVSYRIEIE